MGSVGRYIASVGSGKFQDDECVWRAFPDLLPGGERGLENSCVNDFFWRRSQWCIISPPLPVRALINEGCHWGSKCCFPCPGGGGVPVANNRGFCQVHWGLGGSRCCCWCTSDIRAAVVAVGGFCQGHLVVLGEGEQLVLLLVFWGCGDSGTSNMRSLRGASNSQQFCCWCPGCIRMEVATVRGLNKSLSLSLSLSLS